MDLKRCSSTVVRARAQFCVAVSVVGVMLALAQAASAQTSFRAGVTGSEPKPTLCPFFCGTADIADYGAATWTFTLTDLTEQGTCATYAASVTFELADRSRLVLHEAGTACGPGNSNLSSASSNSYGHPGTANGNWFVQSADGQFSGMTGTGTDDLQYAGAVSAGTYTGTLSR